jgi:hypothetical protein
MTSIGLGVDPVRLVASGLVTNAMVHGKNLAALGETVLLAVRKHPAEDDVREEGH